MLQREIDPEIRADIEKFEEQLERYLSGDLEEDAFRVFRLNNGIYGQRQGGHHQMVRVKVPYGSITAEQLDMFAHIAETYSRGWGHLTTRQNMQFHFVDLEEVPAVLRVFVAGGLGANPHPALALEEFTPREQLMETLEAILRVFSNHGNRDNKLRARMKWLVDTMGWDELQARILKERRFLLASSSWPGGNPEAVQKARDEPAGPLG